MKKITLLALSLMATGLLFIGCKKEIMDHPDAVVANPPSNPLALNGSGNINDYVTFNAAHNVLVFNSFEDVRNLEMIVSELELNYPFDRGNTVAINNTIQQIEMNGYTNGNSSQGNQVNLSDFELLLQNSHPLSDEILSNIIQLHNSVSLPPVFIKQVLMANLPFSYDLAQKIQTASLPPTLKEEMLEADENTFDVPNYAYQDFLTNFQGYQSLYSKLLNQEVSQLENGADPSTLGFGDDLVNLGFERLIYNEKYEVYIEGKLYRLYEHCKAIAIQNSVADAYEDLEVIAPNGDVTIPTLSEGPEGISLEVMNDHVPIGYIVYNPLEFDPLGGPGDDPNYDTALQTFNIIDNCAVSNFVYVPYAAEDFSLQFFDMTDIEGLDASDIYQYWQFGDGTGSFDEAPVHSFPGYGTYNVSLTTFSQDCGCWHVHRIPITINWRTYSGRNPDCPIVSVVPSTIGGDLEENEVDVVVNVGAPANPDNYVVNYIFDFYSQNPEEVPDPAIYLIHHAELGTQWWYDYVLPASGNYWVLVTTIWYDGCATTFTAMSFYLKPPTEPVACCDDKVRERLNDGDDPALTTSYEGAAYYLKVNDLARGTYSRKISTEQILFKKNNKNKWRRYKAYHKVDVVGSYWDRDEKDCLDFHSHVRFYRSCSNYLAKFSDFDSSFPNKFGLKENSMTYEHSVYLGGSMVAVGGTCENSGGVILFDKYLVQLGGC